MQVKGTVLLDAVASTRQREGEAGFNEILELLPESCRTLVQSSLSPIAWYPADSFCQFLETTLSRRGDDGSVLVHRTEAVAEKQLLGTYKAFARMPSAESVVKRIAIIHRTFFAGVGVEIREHSSSSATLRYDGFAPQHRLIEYILQGFFRKALELSGAKNVRTRISVPMADARGYCDLVLSWS